LSWKPFECNNCGLCCRTLLETNDGITLGLTFLTNQEKGLFKNEDIAPKLAFGKREPTTVLSYQLKHNVCPHLVNNKCLIYDKRPLVCRAYPVTCTTGKNIADLKCPQVGKFSAEELLYVVFSDEIDETMTKINSLVDKSLKQAKGQSIWHYDLASKKWKILRNAKV
jgi:Fe-S-cluster containining protein